MPIQRFYSYLKYSAKPTDSQDIKSGSSKLNMITFVLLHKPKYFDIILWKCTLLA